MHGVGIRYLVLAMNDNTYPATPEEFEEYCAVMSAPSPEPSSLNVSEVTDLSFERVSDVISHKWATWEVNFRYDGKPFVGFLGACPNHPILMHDTKIEDCEVNY